MVKNHKQLILFSEFEKFIKASRTGRRLLPSGRKCKPGTIVQYECTLKLIKEYSGAEEPLRILLLHRASLRTVQKEKVYWERFFRKFSDFLYRHKGYFDSYVASVFKILKAFFHYLSIEKALPVGQFHKRFRVTSRSFTPVILTPVQLKKLIEDRQFESGLSNSLQVCKDIFVFGCTVGLRFNDLMQLKKTDLLYGATGTRLFLHTQKTGTAISLLLPPHAIEILEKHKKASQRYILPRISNTNFNLNIKALMEKAGWAHSLPRHRYKRGEPLEIKRNGGACYRFCDQVSAHTMRRTTITNLLLMGMEEAHVRKISGHAPGSKEFYRYVVITQDRVDEQYLAANERLTAPRYQTEATKRQVRVQGKGRQMVG